MLNNNYYDVYVNDTISLAKTLTFKSEISAHLINERLKLIYGESSVDPHDKTSWKYYMNICGEYHPTDSMIYITSLDDLSTIEFTKSSFLIHVSTFNAYQFGSRFYDELIKKYPDQESLIMGVLNPADMSRAVASEDGTILSYDKRYIQSNEYTLLHSIEQWIKNYTTRWDVKPFVLSDNYYAAAVHAQISLNLVPFIINERLKRCKTPEAHAFHVYHYLESHNKLHEFMEYMTQEQIMYFYKNIPFLQSHAGKNSTLTKLIINLFSKRSFPFSSFTMRQTTTEQLQNVVPEVVFKRRIFDSQYENSTLITYSQDAIEKLQSPLAIQNDEYHEQFRGEMLKKYEYSLSSVVQTKMLESSVFDTVDDSREVIMLNEWLYLSTSNLLGETIVASTASPNTFAMLQYNVNFTNPINAQPYMLSVRDCYIYAMYCYGKAVGLDMSYIPEFVSKKTANLLRPTADDIYEYADEFHIEYSVAQSIVAAMPSLTLPITNVEDFKNYCLNVQKAWKYYDGIVALQEHHDRVSIVRNMTSRMFVNKFIKLDESPDGVNTTSFTTWLRVLELPVVDYTASEYMQIYTAVINAAIGLELNEETLLRRTHRAMCNMISRLNSYSVHLLSASSTGKQIIPTWSIVRAGDIWTKSKVTENVQIALENLLSFDAKMKMQWEYLTDRAVANLEVKTSYRNIWEHDFKIGYIGNEGRVIVGKFFVPLGFGLDTWTPLSTQASYDSSIVTGIEYYNVLSAEQQNSLFDIYHKNQP